MLKVLVLNRGATSLIYSKDIALSQSCCNVGFLWCAIWSSLREISTFGGKHSLYVIFFSWIQFNAVLTCQEITEVVHYGSTFPSWKFSDMTSVVLPCCVTLPFFFFLASFPYLVFFFVRSGVIFQTFLKTPFSESIHSFALSYSLYNVGSLF